MAFHTIASIRFVVLERLCAEGKCDSGAELQACRGIERNVGESSNGPQNTAECKLASWYEDVFPCRSAYQDMQASAGSIASLLHQLAAALIFADCCLREVTQTYWTR